MEDSIRRILARLDLRTTKFPGGIALNCSHRAWIQNFESVSDLGVETNTFPTGSDLMCLIADGLEGVATAGFDTGAGELDFEITQSLHFIGKKVSTKN